MKPRVQMLVADLGTRDRSRHRRGVPRGRDLIGSSPAAKTRRADAAVITSAIETVLASGVHSPDLDFRCPAEPDSRPPRVQLDNTQRRAGGTVNANLTLRNGLVVTP